MTSLITVIEKLETFHIASPAEQTKLQGLVAKLKNFESNPAEHEDMLTALRTELNAIMNLESNNNIRSGEETLADAAYNCLLALAESNPNNVRDSETNAPLDCISLSEIDPDDLFVSVTTAEHFNIRHLANWISGQKKFIDPKTNLNFMPRDQIRIQALCVKKGISLRIAAPQSSVGQQALHTPLMQMMRQLEAELPSAEFSVWNRANWDTPNNASNAVKKRSIQIDFVNTTYIDRMLILEKSNGEYEIYIDYSGRGIMLRSALERFGITERTTGVRGFPDLDDQNGGEFEIRGNANTVQDTLVRLVNTIKNLEGDEVFSCNSVSHEQEILNLIPSVAPGLNPPRQNPAQNL